MAVAFVAERAEDADTTNASSYVIGSAFTPTAGNLLIMVITATDSAADFGITSIAETGQDLTWNLIANLNRDNGTVFVDHSVYWAIPTASTEVTTITVTFGESVTGCTGWIGEFSGQHATVPILAGQLTSGEIASGTESPAMSLPSATQSDGMAVFASTVIRNPAAWDSSGDGWTEHADTGHPTPANGTYVASKAGASAQSISYTGTNGGSGGIMFEIAAAAVGGGTTHPGWVGDIGWF